MTDARAQRYAIATNPNPPETCAWVFTEGAAKGMYCRLVAPYEVDGQPRCFLHLPLHADRTTHDMNDTISGEPPLVQRSMDGDR